MKIRTLALALVLPFLGGGAPPPGEDPPGGPDPALLEEEVTRLLEEGQREEAARLAGEALEGDPGLPARLLGSLRPGAKGAFFLLGRALAFLEEEGKPTRDLATALLVRAALRPGLALEIARLLSKGPYLEPSQGDLVVRLWRLPGGDPRREAGRILAEALLEGSLRRSDPVLAFLFLEDQDPLVRAMGAARLCSIREGLYAPLAPLVAEKEEDPRVLHALALGLAFSPLPLGRKARIFQRMARRKGGLSYPLFWCLIQGK